MAKENLANKQGASRSYVWFMLVTLLIFVVAFALMLGGIDGSNFDQHGGLIQVVTFFLAFMPILLVLIGMIGFDLSALKVAPFAFLLAVLLSYTFFANMQHTPVDLARAIWAQTWSGIKSSFFIVGLILFSFLILDMMQTSGAMDIVKAKLAAISGGDRRVQLIIIGLFVPIFMEGAAGAGTPAAIAAPFLVGLGFDPIVAVVAALMSDGVCTSFGGSGLTTMSGGADLVTAGVSNTDLNFAAAGVYHMIGILVMPFLLIIFAYGFKGFKSKGIVGYCLWCGVIGAILMLIFSNFIGGFITDMGTGLIGIIFAILGLKIFKIETPKELYAEPPKIEGKPKYSFVRALSPYIFVLLILPITLTVSKYIMVNNADGSQIPLWNYLVGKLTYNGWIDILLFICSFLSIFTLKFGFGNYFQAFWRALKKVIPHPRLHHHGVPLFRRQHHEDHLPRGRRPVHDQAARPGYRRRHRPALSGRRGSDRRGRRVHHRHEPRREPALCHDAHARGGHPRHQQGHDLRGLHGGSLGNMICPNNVTAACATVGITGEENKVMKRVIVMFLVTFVLYAVLSMLFVYVIFPNVSAEMTNVFARMG